MLAVRVSCSYKQEQKNDSNNRQLRWCFLRYCSVTLTQHASREQHVWDIAILWNLGSLYRHSCLAAYLKPLTLDIFKKFIFKSQTCLTGNCIIIYILYNPHIFNNLNSITIKIPVATSCWNVRRLCMFITNQHTHKQVLQIYIKLLRHVSVLIHHLQGIYSCVS
jgi:hypothetical protein